MSFSSTLAVLFVLAALSGFDGAKIERLQVPEAARNGSGPILLTCVYSIDEDENGLLIKWFHNNEQIYQWMPPMNPIDIGVIKGFAVYPPESRPRTHSIIGLKEVTLNMSGEYTCHVCTFLGTFISDPKRMIVYVPEESLTVQASDFNETHVNLSCLATGARPRPKLTILVESTSPENNSVHFDENYDDNPRVTLSAIAKKTTEPVVVECEIEIPGTGYARREKLVYYPSGGLQNPTIEYINGTSTVESRITSTTVESTSVSEEIKPSTTTFPSTTHNSDQSSLSSSINANVTIHENDPSSTTILPTTDKTEQNILQSLNSTSVSQSPLKLDLSTILTTLITNDNEISSSTSVPHSTTANTEKNEQTTPSLCTTVASTTVTSSSDETLQPLTTTDTPLPTYQTSQPNSQTSDSRIPQTTVV